MQHVFSQPLNIKQPEMQSIEAIIKDEVDRSLATITSQQFFSSARRPTLKTHRRPTTYAARSPMIITQSSSRKITNTPYEVPITDAIPNFQPVTKPRGKLSRSPSIGGEVANFRNPPLAAKLHGNHIDVFIDNQPVKALVDSGASKSVISETYRRKQLKVMFLDTKPVIFKVADGNYVKSLGKCVLQLTINGRTLPFQFTVITKYSHDVILGFDFLKASQAVLDCERAELMFDEPLHDEEIDPHGIMLYTMSDSVVPARSCKFLTVQARDAQDDTDFLVEGNKVMCINQGIAVPSMITSLRKGKA
ncbi:transposon Ty3-I Gag-Pol polyprotein [Trichonephila inaurata madagascariensis]|uniref:Transposon Ty3-I Gag-Pol polyprotein n=1 Tax=Trichonephila inaurata madagascariensis TaxID=2747483 RepID=A0A8X6WZT3_9ARAC|nr:transposon Ty3-I Gag-Pol polyprotein [Trichonephila inaurata madagascariensis]